MVGTTVDHSISMRNVTPVSYMSAALSLTFHNRNYDPYGLIKLHRMVMNQLLLGMVLLESKKTVIEIQISIDGFSILSVALNLP